MTRLVAFVAGIALLCGAASAQADPAHDPVCVAVAERAVSVEAVSDAVLADGEAAELLRCLATRAAPTWWIDWIVCPILALISYYSVAGVIEIGPHGDVWLAVAGFIFDCPPYVGG